MNSRLKIIFYSVFLQFFFCVDCFSGTYDSDWFPRQKAPESVVTVNVEDAFGANHMLVQSISGLAAMAVNEGRFDEMVWIENSSPDYQRWYKDAVSRLGFKESGQFSAWQLVERYKDKGVYEGYILYCSDTSEGGAWTEREGVDQSANVATALASVLKGLLIDESLQERAKLLGLKMLFDARGKDIDWCYEHYRNKLNRRMLLTVDPKAPHNRAYAISHRCAAVFGVGKDTEMFCKWLEPPAPILGWNCGDELKQTALVTEYGHFQTATNWTLNLPILSAGANETSIKKIKSLDPFKISWNDKRYPVSFLMSDGDNVQWMTNNFFFHEDYWANPHNGMFPFGWTGCPSHLIQMAPDVYECLRTTKPVNHTVIEYGAGYYYPDLFASRRTNRKEILTARARQISAQLKKSGVNILGFICKDINSDAAMEAYKIYAKEIEGLIGMVAFQYYPYNAGNGKLFWVPNADGVEIPVITATHSQWQNARWENGGGPFQIAENINACVSETDTDRPDYSLVAVHSWSYFKESETEVERRGLSPVKWCVDEISEKARIMSPEELIWRIRMKHRPAQTKKYLDN